MITIYCGYIVYGFSLPMVAGPFPRQRVEGLGGCLFVGFQSKRAFLVNRGRKTDLAVSARSAYRYGHSRQTFSFFTDNVW